MTSLASVAATRATTPPRNISSDVRLAGHAAWQILPFLINGVVFILIGLQLRVVLVRTPSRNDAEREALIRMRDGGSLSDEVFRRIERDLDLEGLRMEA